MRFAAKALLAGLTGLSFATAGADAQSTARLADFGRQHAVRSWPRLQGCSYDRPWTGVAGTVLIVRTQVDGGKLRTTAESALRRGLTCHVAIRHALQNWPADLKDGTYIVAATAAEGEWPLRPWQLQVVAVARDASPAQAEAAAQEIDARED